MGRFIRLGRHNVQRRGTEDNVCSNPHIRLWRHHTVELRTSVHNAPSPTRGPPVVLTKVNSIINRSAVSITEQSFAFFWYKNNWAYVTKGVNSLRYAWTLLRTRAKIYVNKVNIMHLIWFHIIMLRQTCIWMNLSIYLYILAIQNPFWYNFRAVPLSSPICRTHLRPGDNHAD